MSLPKKRNSAKQSSKKRLVTNKSKGGSSHSSDEDEIELFDSPRVRTVNQSNRNDLESSGGESSETEEPKTSKSNKRTPSKLKYWTLMTKNKN